MIMDGLDTLMQVALSDQLNLSFDTYSSPLPGTPGGRHFSETDDVLNTPVTNSADVNFNFSSADIEISQEALPITGKLDDIDVMYHSSLLSIIHSALAFADNRNCLT